MSKNWNKGEEITAEGLNNQGLKVVAQDTPGMTLKVNPGVAIVDGTIVKYAGGNTGTFTAPVTNDRIDIVSIDAGGVINITQGAENVSPTAPAYLADETVLAEVYLRPGCTEILNDDDSSEAYLYLDSRPLGAGISLIDVSTGAADAGKGIKTDSDGRIDDSFLVGRTKFGGDGSDGALSITSGTTTLDVGAAQYYERNYTSISITGTGNLAFSNPHANGTIIVLKSQGAVVVTSSASAAIDTRGMGPSAGNLPTGILPQTANPRGSNGGSNGGGGGGQAGSQLDNIYTTSSFALSRRALFLSCGAPGGSGGTGSGSQPGTPGTGGRGGGALLIECRGALNFTGTINVSGSDGGAAIDQTQAAPGGGGGGSAATCVILYNSLTSAAGTITAAGGQGGKGGNATSTSGGPGQGGGGGGSFVAAGGQGGQSSGQAGASGGTGAGGGGGCGFDGTGTGGSGGAGGGSIGGLVAHNTIYS